MNQIKCPVCNVPLEPVGDLLQCPNDHCGWVGNAELWAEFIKTKQKLDIAASMLKKIDNTRVILRENLYTVGVRETQKFNSGNIVCVATIDDMRNTIYQLDLHNQKEEKNE